MVLRLLFPDWSVEQNLYIYYAQPGQWHEPALVSLFLEGVDFDEKGN